MIFSSAPFLFFFCFVAIVQWYLIAKLSPERHRLRTLHLFLLAVSYFFYMSWDARFGALIAFSTIVDYLAGLYMERIDRDGKDLDRKSRRRRQLALFMSMATNLGVLCYFKYADFFIGSFADMANLIFPATFDAGERDSLLLKIILPLGISFFTFQSMSYTIDVYRRVIPAEKDPIKFSLYVAFFPQLVAGPIVVARDFLPQLQKFPEFDINRAHRALRWFMLGYLKKTVLADNMAPAVDAIFSSPEKYGPDGHWLGALGFWVQIYGDFSGYSDMAWGTAIFLGFNLPENFRLPYASRSLTEHWQRWHISLISWIRDYLYIPIGGSRVGFARHKFNIFFIMFMAGVWHGAGWTYILWGAIHGTILALESIYREMKIRLLSILGRNKSDKFLPPGLAPVGMSIAFALTSFCTIYLGTLFRSRNLQEGFYMMKSMIGLGTNAFATSFHSSTTGSIALLSLPEDYIRTVALGILAIMIGHLIGYQIFEKNRVITLPFWVEAVLVPPLMILFLQLSPSGVAPFIYFVF